MEKQNIDIIGDIHGHADLLKDLLTKLDYRIIDGVYQNPDRKVAFLGDFIDRGPQQREVLQIVMPMVADGHAMSVMGNHEFNALAFHTPDPARKGCWLRPRTDKNIQQHCRFLEEFLPHQKELSEALNFFKSLPLWIELDGIRIVHACWDEGHVQALGNDPMMSHERLISASDPTTKEYSTIEVLLKGAEYELPLGKFFTDKDGHKRTAVRTQWWRNENCKLDEAVLPPGILDYETGQLPMNKADLVGYGRSEAPVFIGHYWFKGDPERISPNVACLDYSVAKGGKLVAYRWTGESQISNDNFVYVS